MSADRGSTRLLVVGESLFLCNEAIANLANREFASLSVNWLMDRTRLLGGIGPRPIKDFRLHITKAQFQQLRWLYLGILPGSVILLGLAVWFRRRR